MKWYVLVLAIIVLALVLVGCGTEATPAGTRFVEVEEVWQEGGEDATSDSLGSPIAWTVRFDDGTEETVSRCGIEGVPVAGHYYEQYNNGEETYWREVSE